MCHFCVLCPFSHFVFIGHMYFNAILPLVWFVVFLFSLFRLRFFFFLLSLLSCCVRSLLFFVFSFRSFLFLLLRCRLSFLLWSCSPPIGVQLPLLLSSLLCRRRCFVVVVPFRSCRRRLVFVFVLLHCSCSPQLQVLLCGLQWDPACRACSHPSSTLSSHFNRLLLESFSISLWPLSDCYSGHAIVGTSRTYGHVMLSQLQY